MHDEYAHFFCFQCSQDWTASHFFFSFFFFRLLFFWYDFVASVFLVLHECENKTFSISNENIVWWGNACSDIHPSRVSLLFNRESAWGESHLWLCLNNRDDFKQNMCYCTPTTCDSALNIARNYVTFSERKMLTAHSVRLSTESWEEFVRVSCRCVYVFECKWKCCVHACVCVCVCVCVLEWERESCKKKLADGESMITIKRTEKQVFDWFCEAESECPLCF